LTGYRCREQFADYDERDDPHEASP
jgi:hypothetical protein